jgi:hypothetical protein
MVNLNRVNMTFDGVLMAILSNHMHRMTFFHQQMRIYCNQTYVGYIVWRIYQYKPTFTLW